MDNPFITILVNALRSLLQAVLTYFDARG